MSPDLVAARAQVLVPELVHVLRDPGEGVFPARFRLIDRAAPVSAEFMGKAKDFHFYLAILDRPFDNRRCTVDLLFQRKARSCACSFQTDGPS